MSVFTSRNQKTLELPGTDPVGIVTIRELAPKRLEEAAREAQRQGRAALAELAGGLGGGAAGLEPLIDAVLQERRREKEKEKAAPAPTAAETPVAATSVDGDSATPDPLAGYDVVTLLLYGIVHWTKLEMDLPGPEHKDARVAVLEDLRDDTQQYLAREILRLTKPSLFLTAAEKEAARKNG